MVIKVSCVSLSLLALPSKSTYTFQRLPSFSSFDCGSKVFLNLTVAFTLLNSLPGSSVSWNETSSKYSLGSKLVSNKSNDTYTVSYGGDPNTLKSYHSWTKEPSTPHMKYYANVIHITKSGVKNG